MSKQWVMTPPGLQRLQAEIQFSVHVREGGDTYPVNLSGPRPDLASCRPTFHLPCLSNCGRNAAEVLGCLLVSPFSGSSDFLDAHRSDQKLVVATSRGNYGLKEGMIGDEETDTILISWGARQQDPYYQSATWSHDAKRVSCGVSVEFPPDTECQTLGMIGAWKETSQNIPTDSHVIAPCLLRRGKEWEIQGQDRRAALKAWSIKAAAYHPVRPTVDRPKDDRPVGCRNLHRPS
ncbi:hypothetical protein SODALDRAFT_355810 [Sodiomyces alkalinus F11]|uniref:Uncharacterized protein n=1 Tax=Sodiomyces alkalinus (strain CBS 110278 / VKM F-3762 / F11) TaxID=1314773 RepID=A0A3N2QA03_SODAK|nr:hypothetical protein SODALDRAFT_355810 [Sodiomyces alkalinus F11]ROT43593.1 hypothetical protein SODALDRAFT_355810 [Sodiomyces alkalinus F11]